MSRGLKPLEFLILAKVEEFTSKGNYCYITNSSLAKLFGVSDRTIKACIKKLIEKGLLKKTSIDFQKNFFLFPTTENIVDNTGSINIPTKVNIGIDKFLPELKNTK